MTRRSAMVMVRMPERMRDELRRLAAEDPQGRSVSGIVREAIDRYARLFAGRRSCAADADRK